MPARPLHAQETTVDPDTALSPSRGGARIPRWLAPLPSGLRLRSRLVGSATQTSTSSTAADSRLAKALLCFQPAGWGGTGRVGGTGNGGLNPSGQGKTVLKCNRKAKCFTSVHRAHATHHHQDPLLPPESVCCLFSSWTGLSSPRPVTSLSTGRLSFSY